jgi:hypothetical protein
LLLTVVKTFQALAAVKNRGILGAQSGTEFSDNFSFVSSALNNVIFSLPCGSLLLLFLQQWWSLFSWLWMMLAG